VNELRLQSFRYDNLLHVAAAIGLVEALGRESTVGWTSISNQGGTAVLSTPLDEPEMRMRIGLRIGSIHSAWKAFAALAPRVKEQKKEKLRSNKASKGTNDEEPRRTSAADFRDLMLTNPAAAELIVPYYTVSVTDGVGLYKSPLQMSVRTSLPTTINDLLAPASALLTTRAWLDSLLDQTEWDKVANGLHDSKAQTYYNGDSLRSNSGMSQTSLPLPKHALAEMLAFSGIRVFAAYRSGRSSLAIGMQRKRQVEESWTIPIWSTGLSFPQIETLAAEAEFDERRMRERGIQQYVTFPLLPNGKNRVTGRALNA
jgi:hypothetical protein